MSSIIARRGNSAVDAPGRGGGPSLIRELPETGGLLAMGQHQRAEVSRGGLPVARATTDAAFDTIRGGKQVRFDYTPYYQNVQRPAAGFASQAVAIAPPAPRASAPSTYEMGVQGQASTTVRADPGRGANTFAAAGSAAPFAAGGMPPAPGVRLYGRAQSGRVTAATRIGPRGAPGEAFGGTRRGVAAMRTANDKEAAAAARNLQYANVPPNVLEGNVLSSAANPSDDPRVAVVERNRRQVYLPGVLQSAVEVFPTAPGARPTVKIFPLAAGAARAAVSRELSDDQPQAQMTAASTAHLQTSDTTGWRAHAAKRTATTPSARALAERSTSRPLFPGGDISFASWYRAVSGANTDAGDTNLRWGRAKMHLCEFGGLSMTLGVFEPAPGDRVVNASYLIVVEAGQSATSSVSLYGEWMRNITHGVASAVSDGDILMTFGGLRVAGQQYECVSSMTLFSARGAVGVVSDGGSNAVHISAALKNQRRLNYSLVAVETGELERRARGEIERLLIADGVPLEGARAQVAAIKSDELVPPARAYANLCGLADGWFLLFGGVDIRGPLETPLADCWIIRVNRYSRTIDAVVRLPDVPFRPRILGATVAFDGGKKALVIGGANTRVCTSSEKDVWVFDAEALTWTEVYNRDALISRSDPSYRQSLDPLGFVDFAATFVPSRQGGVIILDGGRSTPSSEGDFSKCVLNTEKRTWLLHPPGSRAPSGQVIPLTEVRWHALSPKVGDELVVPPMFGHSGVLARVDSDDFAGRPADSIRDNFVVRFHRGKVRVSDPYGYGGELISRPAIAYHDPKGGPLLRNRTAVPGEMPGQAQSRPRVGALEKTALQRHREHIARANEILIKYRAETVGSAATILNGPIYDNAASAAVPQSLDPQRFASWKAYVDFVCSAHGNGGRLSQVLFESVPEYEQLMFESVYGPREGDRLGVISEEVDMAEEGAAAEAEDDPLFMTEGAVVRIIPKYDLAIAYIAEPRIEIPFFGSDNGVGGVARLGFRGVASKVETGPEKTLTTAETGIIIAAGVFAGVLALLGVVLVVLSRHRGSTSFRHKEL